MDYDLKLGVDVNYVYTVVWHVHEMALSCLDPKTRSLTSHYIPAILDNVPVSLPSSLTNTDLVNDGLHVRLVFLVSIEKSRPLLWTDPQPTLHGNPDYLGIVLPSECLVRTELCRVMCECV